MRLTKNFWLNEFNCNDGTVVPNHLLDNVKSLSMDLQVLRDYFDSPIKINSAYRHELYNSTIGGSKNSQHILAKAADIVVVGVSANEVANKIEELMNNHTITNGGLGRYNNFTHIDIREYPARWDFRK